VEIVVQVNGKVRARFDASPESSREELEDAALQIPRIREYLEESELVKLVVVPGKLVSLVVR
jgi:leucyl-tRNA synthetase